MNDVELIREFVAAFATFDGMSVVAGADSLLLELRDGQPGKRAATLRPMAVSTDRSALEPVYERLGARFPPLYENLVLSYRWAKVDLELFTLLANPPGPNLDGLVGEILRDPAFVETLIPHGYSSQKALTLTMIPSVLTFASTNKTARGELCGSITSRSSVIAGSKK